MSRPPRAYVVLATAFAAAAQAQEQDHSGQAHSGHTMHEPYQSGPVLPPITDADRAAAFPNLPGHGVHDRAVNSFWLIDQLEWQDSSSMALAWDAQAWIGTDIQRLWLRTEGEREDSSTTAAELHALWGRKVTTWWDFVAGLRQDFKPGPSQTFGAIGFQGLAPYKFEVEATAYFGEGGQTAARFKAEYELLLTSRWILQPLIEVNVYGKEDEAREIGAGLSSAEAGLRLRYEVRREFAPYIGVSWDRKLGDSADFAEALGDDANEARFTAGVRAWF
jgi:copper resistance protein B